MSARSTPFGKEVNHQQLVRIAFENVFIFFLRRNGIFRFCHLLGFQELLNFAVSIPSQILESSLKSSFNK